MICLMKRLINLLFLAAAVLLLACQKEKGTDTEPASSSFYIKKATLAIMPEGGTCGLEVEAEEPVTVTTDRDWCTATVDGKNITVTATANTTIESRYCRLTLQSGSQKLYATVQQFGEVIDGFDALTGVTSPVEGREIVVDVVSNVSVVLSASEPWIHPVYEDGKVKITVDENNEPRTRVGTVTYKVGSKSGSFEVTQYPALTRPENWVLSFGTPTYEYPDFTGEGTLVAEASDMYVLFFVPESEVEGDIDNWIFDHLAVEARNEILGKMEAAPGSAFKDYLLTGSDPYLFRGFQTGDNYLVAIGFGENGFVSGRYQYAKVTVADIRPTYYKWTGKWNLSGKNIKNAKYEETFELSVDETDVDESGKQKEQYLVVHGLCSKNAEGAGVTPEMNVDGMYVQFDKETGAITFYGQNGEATFTHSSRGDGCRLQLMSMYIKAGATSYTNVTGGKFLSAKMNEDGNTTELTILERSAGLLYKAFRMRLLNAGGSAYTIGGDDATIALDESLTITRAQ